MVLIRVSESNVLVSSADMFITGWSVESPEAESYERSELDIRSPTPHLGTGINKLAQDSQSF